MSKIPKSEFVFRKHMSVGEIDAESDKLYLEDCFTDIGDFDVLCDTSIPQCIVLGRTGVGKSALLEQIEKSMERVIRIEPEELALRHVSNSTILKFFEDLGVKLDIFYNLLWQHTFAVELIKKEYGIDSPDKKRSFIQSISSLLSGDTKKQQALSYIDEWGDRFWLDTESRIKEFTEKLEASFKSEIDGKIPGLNLKSGAASALTEEQKSEVIHYGKKVVSSVQIQKLSKIVSLLAEDIFTDEKQKTYILIDKLDENWVEDDLRHKLIRALIETVKKFRNIKPVKIIFTLRTDLLNRVLEKTRDSGFQKEKYNSFFLNIHWNKAQIKDLLDKRINKLLKHKYTKDNVYFEDIFPSKMDKTSGIDYIIDRTFLRPRDAIMFVNFCLNEAEGKTEMTSSLVKLAEKRYSHDRLDSLKYEWFVEHPNLEKYINLLHKKTYRFKFGSLDNKDFDNLLERLLETIDSNPDAPTKLAQKFFNSSYPKSNDYLIEFKQNVIFTLYKVGAVGIKPDGTSTTKWIQDRTPDLTPEKILPTSIISVHKALWRALAIDER